MSDLQRGESAGMPLFEGAEGAIARQVRAQKEGEATQAVVDTLRENTGVVIHP